jgi:hypothetical protein
LLPKHSPHGAENTTHSVSTIGIETMYIYRNTQVHSCKHCCRVKSISTTYSQCTSVALRISYAMRKRCITVPVARPSIHYFLTLPHKRHGFLGGGRKFTEHKMCVLDFSKILSETSLIPTRIQRYITTNAHRFSCTVPVICVRF